jgi:hypothetical protein
MTSFKNFSLNIMTADTFPYVYTLVVTCQSTATRPTFVGFFPFLFLFLFLGLVWFGLVWFGYHSKQYLPTI